MTRKAHAVWLCLPPTVACWVDVSATLLGQGRRYWSGDYTSVIEGNPAARLLLQLHPLAFVAAAAVSCIVVAGAVVLFNHRLALAITFVVTFGHTVAAAAWAARAGPVGIVGAVGLLMAAERLITLSWKKADVKPIPTAGGGRGGAGSILIGDRLIIRNASCRPLHSAPVGPDGGPRWEVDVFPPALPLAATDVLDDPLQVVVEIGRVSVSYPVDFIHDLVIHR